MDELIAQCLTAAQAAGCATHQHDALSETVTLITEHAGTEAVAVSSSLAGGALTDALAAAGVDIVDPGGSDDPAAAVADLPVGVVFGELAVAETGGVLVSEHALADRVVSMLCRRLVAVVDADAVVASLDDAAAWLAARGPEASFASLITGPSRTADIERSLTIGVQGPDAMDVVVLR